ncbi:MAG: ribose 5-phosphate isomerase B [Candidatus Paraimprobicoccus trichonymphae]|uniref:Ribose 5-phosphate isomerase B n=1 Tax=Candidatus Paraimprobicoccus trichonymphae TaxID=3033793 RepID=A0AA48I0G8_9FIRM|nr:MAG: ribose 5-phosphate isomerase B [Candidatus Paraimprobicoccus trichonymphae]
MNEFKKILYIGSDHAGFNLKEKLKIHFDIKLINFEDVGIYNKFDFDYPIIAEILTKKILEHKRNLGILICGTGIGMCISANKIKKVRAAVCFDEDYSELARKHNNINVLCLGARFISSELAIKIVEVFLNTKFDGGRHSKRLKLISKMENKHI